MQQRSSLKQWKELENHKNDLGDVQIKSLFANDTKRFDEFHLSHKNIMLDYSKQLVTHETMDKLIDLAKACDIEGWRSKMFEGATINTTENRAVLHTALRTKSNDPIMVDGENIIPKIRDAQNRMKEFSNKIRKEKTYTHIVNIGVGGSDLSSSMVYEALKHYSDRGIAVHFVSNIDSTHLSETLQLIDPEKTLFIVSSKTFTTQETMANAHSAKSWMQDKLKRKDVSAHFVAVSQNIDLAKEFGISDNNIFPIWDWVGGRFSLWSSIGLSFCIAIGFDNFKELLGGARDMDQHFLNAPLEKNMPVLLAMIGVWHRNFLNLPAASVTLYDQYLWQFPAYLQQLEMESNGKSIDRNGVAVSYETCPAILSGIGTNAQHAYFQMFHQGTDIIPCDFIVVAKTHNPINDHHKKLLANAIAQSKALMDGREDKNPHKSFAGNRPSNTIIIDELTPYSLGMLLALYEHKVFVQGIIWNINSFDQCGVELGKILARQIIDDFDKDIKDIKSDSSTLGIMKYIDNL